MKKTNIIRNVMPFYVLSVNFMLRYDFDLESANFVAGLL